MYIFKVFATKKEVENVYLSPVDGNHLSFQGYGF